MARALAAARARGLHVVVDPARPQALALGELHGVLALTPNEQEARACAVHLAGCAADAEPDDIAGALAALGPALVCIKLAHGGCLAWHGGRAWRHAPVPVARVDATGAGDAFTAALAVALLEGRAAADAVTRAVAASEHAVGVFGAQPGLPWRAQLEARLALERPRPVPWPRA